MVAIQLQTVKRYFSRVTSEMESAKERQGFKDLYSEDDIRIYVELAADLAGDFQCRLATPVEVVADSGCAYSEKFRELGLIQPHFVHPQLNGFDKGGVFIG